MRRVWLVIRSPPVRRESNLECCDLSQLLIFAEYLRKKGSSHALEGEPVQFGHAGFISTVALAR